LRATNGITLAEAAVTVFARVGPTCAFVSPACG